MKRNVGAKQAKARAHRREKKQVKAGELKHGGRRPDKGFDYESPLFEGQVLAALGGSLDPWAKRCHEASIALVKAGIGDRVARGFCTGVGGQHSWAVVGMDCYDEDAQIIDPTLWSYTKTAPKVWSGSMKNGLHRPHGHGSIWEWGQPQAGGGATIRLTPRTPFSKMAQHFLDLLGPLDFAGWSTLASKAPVKGWPAAEILAAITDTTALSAVVPIDRIGMLTDRNPGGLYLRG